MSGGPTPADEAMEWFVAPMHVPWYIRLAREVPDPSVAHPLEAIQHVLDEEGLAVVPAATVAALRTERDRALAVMRFLADDPARNTGCLVANPDDPRTWCGFCAASAFLAGEWLAAGPDEEQR